MDTTVFAAHDNAYAESVYAAVIRQMHLATIEDSCLYMNGNPNGLDKGMDSTQIIPALCPAFPKTMTIYYGTTNTTCDDGKNRRGEIIAVFSGRYQDSLTTVDISFNDYFEDDVEIKGNITFNNKGTNANGNLHYGFSIQNGLINDRDTIRIEWAATRTWEWEGGFSSAKDPDDDSWMITGSSSGRTTKGNAFTSTIIQPLNVEWDCNYPTTGLQEVAPNNLALRRIDYGSGCDNLMDVTINATTQNISILY